MDEGPCTHQDGTFTLDVAYFTRYQKERRPTPKPISLTEAEQRARERFDIW